MAPAILIIGLWGCGDKTQLFGHHQPAPSARTPTASDDPQPGAPGSLTAISEEIQRKLYDESLDHTATGRTYFQDDPSLSDLFSQKTATPTSQLCWPAALAYQMDYESRVRQPALPRLAPPVSSPSEAIRYFTNLCGTDHEVGTTAPQGVSCLNRYFASAGYDASITVTGVDSKWTSSYPAGKNASPAPVSPKVLQQALDDDASVILLVGFYETSAGSQKLQRVRGHFISVTGFGHLDLQGDTALTLFVVNPGVDYTQRGDGQKSFDRIAMVPASAPVGLSLPTDVSYMLRGPGFSQPNEIALIESAITFLPQ